MEIKEKATKIVAECDDLKIACIRQNSCPRASTISKIGADGIKTIYLSTSMGALKTKRIQANPKTSLCFCKDGNNITLTGRAAVTQENAPRRSLWQDWMIKHFPDGAAGDTYCLPVFETEEAEFWIDGEGAAFGRDDI